MGRWAQAERAGSGLLAAGIRDYSVDAWTENGGKWRFNWVCLDNPVRWEIEVWLKPGADWAYLRTDWTGGTSRWQDYNIGIGTVLRAKLRPYIVRGFCPWTDWTYTP